MLLFREEIDRDIPENFASLNRFCCTMAPPLPCIVIRLTNFPAGLTNTARQRRSVIWPCPYVAALQHKGVNQRELSLQCYNGQIDEVLANVKAINKVISLGTQKENKLHKAW